ncbi:protein of unknown function [Vibrio tapetis subsp. tapetis]|uniref:Uncharacterized protein n=1 Tax=Vibrio tapetis subsp. tapetis TaxID=1671868 RepID=A0A2N8ZN46_9VIBR|nr:protein of unknown function [Vibrio tapetis subsp. tapetis]SON53312.1 protein of unknown function [Vibrio tapetis subsp. tapetis]
MGHAPVLKKTDMLEMPFNLLSASENVYPLIVIVNSSLVGCDKARSCLPVTGFSS